MTARYGDLLGISGSGGSSPTAMTATNDTNSGAEDTIIEGNVLSNDTTESGTLSVLDYRLTIPGEDYPTVYQPGQAAVVGALGVFVLASNGAYSFTPAANYSGPVPTIRYTATNGDETRLGSLTLTVTPANDAPIAGDAAALSFGGEAVTIDVADFVSDPDPGDSVTLTHVNETPVVLNDVVSIDGGTYEWAGGTEVTITPSSSDPATLELTYTIEDESGVSDTGNIMVQVGVENTPLFSPVSPLLGNPIDIAALNFGKTYRRKWGSTDENGVAVSSPPYSAGQGYFPVDPVYQAPTDREPWLYDRATTLWLLAKRTNNPIILAEAMQLARGYMNGVQLSGSGTATFNIIGNTGGDPQDVKYLYGVVAWWYERETLAAGGSTQQAQAYRSRAQGLYRQTLISFTQTYNPNTAELWTERNSWAAIMNCLAWYWISGDETALADATSYVEDVLDLAEATGAWLHSKDKHESDGDPTLIVSPWMSALLAEGLLQYHRTTDSEGLSKSIPEVLSDFGDWLIANAFYTATGTEEPELAGLAGLRLPAYLAGTGVQFAEGEAADMEHVIDVAELMRKVKWAKEELDLDTTDVDALIDELEEAAETVIAYWTRSTVGYPRYRVNPPRKYGWEYRCRYSYVHSVGIVPFAPSLTTAPVLSGSNQQGSELSCTDGIWAGRPTPTFTYQWRRSGEDIDGATASTYTTTESDVGESIDCVVTATNDGGSASADSNNITVVTAGAPEFTAQPSNVTRLVGETATFTVTVTGDPSPDLQWQVSTDGGETWDDVTDGTGGTTDSYTTETLSGTSNGYMYRCEATNTGGTVYSDPATLTMVVQQEAVRFADSGDYGVLTHTFGGAGFVDATICGWARIRSLGQSAIWFGVTGAAGRTAGLLMDNSFPNPLVGCADNQVGGQDFANQPPLDEWVFFTWRGYPTAATGESVATWASEDGEDFEVIGQGANGIAGSLSILSTILNGGGTEGGSAIDFQHVRAYSRRFTDQECEDERARVDLSDPDLQYFCVFEDNGGGGVTCRDASGHNRVFTLTGAALNADGPVAPTV